MAMRTLYNINETVQSSQNGELPEMAKQMQLNDIY